MSTRIHEISIREYSWDLRNIASIFVLFYLMAMLIPHPNNHFHHPSHLCGQLMQCRFCLRLIFMHTLQGWVSESKYIVWLPAKIIRKKYLHNPPARHPHNFPFPAIASTCYLAWTRKCRFRFLYKQHHYYYPRFW